MHSRQVQIDVWADGENVSDLLDEMKEAWTGVWETHYATLSGPPAFRPAKNLKSSSAASGLLPEIRGICDVRNPDLLFTLADSGAGIGGVEITTHSPDGSNADKRYPFLWASRRAGMTGFVVCPYSKERPGGATNRLPFRHAERNLAFSKAWKPGNPSAPLVQILPITELQDGPVLERSVAELMPGIGEVASVLAHTSALLAGGPAHHQRAMAELFRHQDAFSELAHACMNATTRTEPSSLLTDGGRWVQVYNSRPDSGHWERGEGQFDSIDGRLMFTLDTIALIPEQARPSSLEFWLPQMCSNHPWIREQRERGFGSKRLRNILVGLRDEVKTKFADTLTARDWRLLRSNPGLVLERDDWEPGIYEVAELVGERNARAVAGVGLKSPSRALLDEIEGVLLRRRLYFSAHRAYREGWEDDLCAAARRLPAGAELLIPRIPGVLAKPALANAGSHIHLVVAEDCTRAQLVALRQLHRSR